MNVWSFAAVAALAAAPMSVVVLADRPTDGIKPITEIVGQLEKQGYGPFSEIDYDDGNWEVEVYKDDVAYELAVDGRSGKILSEHRDEAEPRPPHGALPLSQILHMLTTAEYTNTHDVSFERRYWEVETFRGAGKRELHVEPTTGEIISNRRDD